MGSLNAQRFDIRRSADGLRVLRWRIAQGLPLGLFTVTLSSIALSFGCSADIASDGKSDHSDGVPGSGGFVASGGSTASSGGSGANASGGLGASGGSSASGGTGGTLTGGTGGGTGSTGGSGGSASGGLGGTGGSSTGGNASGGTGGDNGGGGCDGFSQIVSKTLFDQLFPLNIRHSLYTWEGMVEATASYPGFATEGDCDTRKREVAAFLANMARETGRLKYAEQIAKDDYCQQGNTDYPCAPGKQYYGRGPIQLSWNYNYGAASEALGLGLQLLQNPDIVAQDSKIAWQTGLWFWNTSGGITCHDAMVDGYGFGQTIDTINGNQECDGAWPEAVAERVQFYQEYCEKLGVDPGDHLEC